MCELLDITDSLSESMKFICLQYIFSHYNEVIISPEYQKLSETLKMEIQQRFEQESQNSLISFFRAVAHQDVDDIKLAIKTEILTFLEDQFDIGDIETEFEYVQFYHFWNNFNPCNPQGCHGNTDRRSDVQCK